MTNSVKPLVLAILDGWGLNNNKKESAIAAAQVPFMNQAWEKYPHAKLSTSGEAVGLTEGQMGNSEVGHLNIGAGRVVYQDLTKISKAIREKTFFENPVLLAAMQNCKEHNSALHLMGLFSDGGVHSHIDHLYGLLKMAKASGLNKVFVHAFLDGRDVPPRCAEIYFKDFNKKTAEIGLGQIATLTGRYYAMDRDNRWERVSQAYEMITELKGFSATSALEGLQAAYARGQDPKSGKIGEDDEFVKPTIVKGAEPLQENDSLIFFNFRPDRAREITHCFVDPDFKGFSRNKFVKVHYVCMTTYDAKIKAPVAYPKDDVDLPLAEVLSNAGLKQLHTAETEKYAHVTFFFNGGREEPFPGEERLLVNSPKVATYDLQPEMSAYGVTEKVLEAIAAKKYDVIILNFANGDMVGHTGVFAAAVKAVEAVDQCVAKIAGAVLAQGGEMLITADHGNADQMIDTKGGVMTAHSLNPVPLIYVTEKKNAKLHPQGILADIAPTMLDILGIKKPREFTGRSLLE